MTSLTVSQNSTRSSASREPTASTPALLCGDKVILRAPHDDDLPMLAELRNDVELQTRLMSIARPNSVERVREWLTRRGSDPDGLFFIVAHRVDNATAGFVQVQRIDWVHGHAWLGICLAASARGVGIGGETLSLVESYLVNRFRLRKLMLEVLAINQRAVGFYSRAGYEIAGIWRRHFYADGQFHDVQIMEKHLSPVVDHVQHATAAPPASRATDGCATVVAAKNGARIDSAHTNGDAQ